MSENRLGGMVRILVGRAALEGDFMIPPGSRAMVLFAHGSGSGRLSPRNRMVAGILNRAGIGTFLIDLLTKGEEVADLTSGKFRFNIRLLTDRLIGTTDWLLRSPETSKFALGYFGASTGAAAALIAAAERPEVVKAVVSRGGRPDLAKEKLVEVKAPTLLIVGGNDTEVLKLNQEALSLLDAPKELAVVPGATHLFEEPGTLEEVANLATRWFTKYLLG